MRFVKSIYAVDSHTMGEPTRVVVGGIPNVPGNTMMEKKHYLEEHYDNIRTALMLEPRGHRDMFGSIVLPPCDPKADLGIVFMEGDGFVNMCGHGSIGACAVAVETGLVEAKEPYTDITLECPVGLIKALRSITARQSRLRLSMFRRSFFTATLKLIFPSSVKLNSTLLMAEILLCSYTLITSALISVQKTFRR